MTAASLSKEVRLLLEEHLHSYEKLEILLALRRGSAMSRADIAHASRLDEEMVATVLTELVASRLVELDGTSARVAASAREGTCEALMRLYEEDRSAILSVASTIAVRRVRNLAARAFSEAFVIRKKGRDEDG